MKAKDFLLEQYGITLSNEKAVIHPAMLEKAMNEYAMHQCQELLSNSNNKAFIIPVVSGEFAAFLKHHPHASDDQRAKAWVMWNAFAANYH